MGRIALDGYIRVSQVRGREGASFISPAVQQEQIERWAAMRDVEIAVLHTDLDQSGAKDERAGLQAALERIESGESEGLVVAKLDRFARSLTGALRTINRIEAAGGKFVSVQEGIDPTTPAGKLQQNIMLVFAEFELDRIRENWSVAQERAVARGVHIASKTPTGYVRGEDGRLQIHAEYGPVIAELFRLRAAGGSWRELADHLNRHGVVGPYGSPYWRTRAVTHIIGNRAYLGEARSGRHTNPNAHESLIDRSTWEAAQTARGASVPRGDDPAILAGLIRCAGCRYLLKPDKMRLRDGSQARLYRCRGEHSAGVCKDRAATLERVVLPVVEDRFFAAVGNITARGDAHVDLAAAEEAVQAAEVNLALYRDDERVATALGADRYVQGLEQRAGVLDEAQRHAATLRRNSTLADEFAHVDLRSLWAELTVAERQRLLMAAFDCMILRSGRSLPIENRLLFLRRGDAPDDLPRRGRRGALRPFAWPSDGPGAIGEAATKDL